MQSYARLKNTIQIVSNDIAVSAAERNGIGSLERSIEQVTTL